MRYLFSPNPTVLFTPAGDFLLAGGLSIICFILLRLFVDPTIDMPSWIVALTVVAFFVNFPHFIASYMLFYGTSRRQFFSFAAQPLFTLRVWFAGIIVPIAMCAYVVVAFKSGSVRMFGYFLIAMFFFVGWHYVKQIYGCTVLLSLAKGVRFSRNESRTILLPLYLLWMISFLGYYKSGGDAVKTYLGLPYELPWINPEMLRTPAFVLLALATVLLIGMFVRKYLREHVVPPVSSFVALCSIYVWYLPLFAHPLFLLAVPVFHSMQYQLFVLAYGRNAALTAIDRESAIGKKTAKNILLWGYALVLFLPLLLFLVLLPLNGYVHLRDVLRSAFGISDIVHPSLPYVLVAAICAVGLIIAYLARRSSVSHTARFTKFFVVAAFVGFFVFELVPTSLDLFATTGKMPAALRYDPLQMGYMLYYVIIAVFVNIHHYFIDNVLWKRENHDISAHILPCSRT